MTMTRMTLTGTLSGGMGVRAVSNIPLVMRIDVNVPAFRHLSGAPLHVHQNLPVSPVHSTYANGQVYNTGPVRFPRRGSVNSTGSTSGAGLYRAGSVNSDWYRRSSVAPHSGSSTQSRDRIASNISIAPRERQTSASASPHDKPSPLTFPTVPRAIAGARPSLDETVRFPTSASPGSRGIYAMRRSPEDIGQGMSIPRGPPTPEEGPRGVSWSSLNSRRPLGDFSVHRRHNSKGEQRFPPVDGDISDGSDDVVGQLNERQSVRSVRGVPGAMSIEQLTAWWESEARRKEEKANRKEEEASKKEEEARRLEEKARQSLEEARRLEARARQADASARVREAAAQSKETKAKLKEAEAKKREAAAEKREAEAQRKEEYARYRELEALRKEEQAQRKEDNARKREDDARRREKDARQREMLCPTRRRRTRVTSEKEGGRRRGDARGESGDKKLRYVRGVKVTCLLVSGYVCARALHIENQSCVDIPSPKGPSCRAGAVIYCTADLRLGRWQPPFLPQCTMQAVA